MKHVPVGIMLGWKIALRGALGRAAIERTPPASTVAGAGRDALGHAEEPPSDRFFTADETGSIGEHYKDRLERILGVVGILQRRPAYAVNHRPMPDHQLFERRLSTIILLRNKPVQKLGIGDRSHRAKLEYAIDLSNYLVR